MNEDIEWIRSHIETGDYQFRKHAAERASERGINSLDAKAALLSGRSKRAQLSGLWKG